MSELSFLISLILNEKLPLELKQLIADRIQAVEQGMGRSQILFPNQLPPVTQVQNVAPIQNVAQTPAAAAALASRQQAISMAASDKPEPGRTSPRKF